MVISIISVESLFVYILFHIYCNITGYWDDGNLIICASKEYESIIEHVIDFIQPKKAKFAFRTVFGGRNLMILSV